MTFLRTLLPGIGILLSLSLSAQNNLPIPRNLQKSFDKGIRDAAGAPGSKYWQNTADYDIQVSFDPATRLISGTETIRYVNNSPDTLRQINYIIYPNLYKKGAQRLMTVEAADLTDGMEISRLQIGDQVINNAGKRANGTNLPVFLQKPLMPGQSVQCSAAFSYTLNGGSHIRTGMVEEGAYFIAYFFPRIAVYDDVDGWNRNQYLGTQEFYNDFCNFNVAITVPKDFLVWATGDLLNCNEVFAPKFCERLAQAERSDAVISVIDTSDLKLGGVSAQNATNTFKFKALDVTDIAVGISNHYIWKSCSLVVDSLTMRRSRVDAVFNPKHRDYYEVVHFARKTLESMSFRFPRWPYPYQHETVFDGLDQMEYPMMVNDNPLEDRAESIELTDHEIMHTMFPFYMGINETKYGWMDEGWATIGEWLISPMIDPSIIDEYGIARYESVAGTEVDLPITTLTTMENGPAMFINSYPKPGMAYLFSMDILGDKFYKGLHHYIRQWHGKHPTPPDFFNCMNTGSGVNLNWFWKKWFYDGGVPNLAISTVSDQKKKKRITVECKGTLPLPVDLTVTFADGSEQKIHRSAAVWEMGNKTVEVEFVSEKTIKKIELGSTYVPDIDKKDNVVNR
ncbi:MAG: M1 family metallopeptidase [Bacteroidota bacterium]